MTTDRYTKLILTVIAGALVGLLVQNAFRPATAQNESCGKTADTACYVMSHYNTPVTVGNSLYRPLEVKVVP